MNIYGFRAMLGILSTWWVSTEAFFMLFGPIHRIHF